MGKKISVIFGTRPEAIKLVSVIRGLKNDPRFDVHVCVSAQHRYLLDQVLMAFHVQPDVDLNIMKPSQSLSELTANAINGLDGYFNKYKPDLALVQGDTTTVFAASLVSFYHKIPVGHVEAGLRTNNKFSPFPEEINRVLTTHIADLHFAPTELSKKNLVKEGVAADRIFVTGNTVIDALLLAKEKVERNPPHIDGITEQILKNGSPTVLITGHRRENFGDGFKSICSAIATLAEEFPAHNFIYPVHLNPNVRDPVFRMLGNKKNIHLIEPLSYLPFVSLMLKSKLILTDSGGIQEEAPTFGIPVLVMRDTTERPEGITAGSVKLVGTSKERIIEETSLLLTDESTFTKMTSVTNPYGDGRASERIIQHIVQYLE